MDIRLETNSDDPFLEFRDCRALDKTDFSSFLVLRSGPFRVDISYWFDRHSLASALVGLKQIHSSLLGECKLQYRYEEPFISFKGDGRGHVKISGLLTQTGTNFQRFEFDLQTDQTCLPSLISAFERLLGE